MPKKWAIRTWGKAMILPNPYDPGDPVDVVKYQIFEYLAAGYPLTFAELVARAMGGEQITDGASLVSFILAAVDDMMKDGVVIGHGQMLTLVPQAVAGIPYPEPTPQVELEPNPQAEPEQLNLFGNT